MTPLLRKLLHLGVIVTAVVARVWEGCERLFQSKAQIARRSTGRFEALKRAEMEAERLDRLRNPNDYRGR
jgi:hypothetical protein